MAGMIRRGTGIFFMLKRLRGIFGIDMYKILSLDIHMQRGGREGTLIRVSAHFVHKTTEVSD